MKKWYYGWELLQLQDWTPTELLNHIKNGLPAYDEKIDRQIFDRDTLPHKKKTPEEIKQDIRKRTGDYFTRREGNRTTYALRSEIDDDDLLNWELDDNPPLLTAQAKNEFKTQIGIPIIPPGHDAMAFALPTSKGEALGLFDKIKLFRYKGEDIIEYEQRNECPLPANVSTEKKAGVTLSLEAMSKGGSAPKQNAAIMGAAKKFISANPKRIDESASVIAQAFWKNCKSSKPIDVTVDYVKYEVYSDGKKVYSSCVMGKKGKYHDKSISYSTFLAKYIPEAKREVKLPKSNNT